MTEAILLLDYMMKCTTLNNFSTAIKKINNRKNVIAKLQIHKLSLSNPGEKIINFRGKQMLRNKPGLQEQQHLSSIINTQHADLGAHFLCSYIDKATEDSLLNLFSFHQKMKFLKF